MAANLLVARTRTTPTANRAESGEYARSLSQSLLVMGAGGRCVLELPQRIPRHKKVMWSGHEKTLVPSIETGTFPLFCDIKGQRTGFFRCHEQRNLLLLSLRLLIVADCISTGKLAAHELAVALLLVRVWYAGYTQG